MEGMCSKRIITPKRNYTIDRKRNVLYVMPSVVLILFFLYVPALYGFVFSFYKIKYMAVGDFVGISNYIKLLSNRDLWTDFGRTLVFTLSSMAITVCLGLLISTWLDNLSRGWSRVMQTIIMIPWVISVVVSALLWRWLLNTDTGLLPYLLKTVFHASSTAFLENAKLSMISLIFVAVWRTTGYAVLLLYAGLKSISEDVYEAADIDGTTGLQKMMYVRLPLIKTQMLIVMIVLTLSYFNNVELAATLTGGGPGSATTLISLSLYREAFTYYNFGTASALAIMLFLLNLVLVALYMKFTRWRYE